MLSWTAPGEAAAQAAQLQATDYANVFSSPISLLDGCGQRCQLQVLSCANLSQKFQSLQSLVWSGSLAALHSCCSFRCSCVALLERPCG